MMALIWRMTSEEDGMSVVGQKMGFEDGALSPESGMRDGIHAIIKSDWSGS